MCSYKLNHLSMFFESFQFGPETKQKNVYSTKANLKIPCERDRCRRKFFLSTSFSWINRNHFEYWKFIYLQSHSFFHRFDVRVKYSEFEICGFPFWSLCKGAFKWNKKPVVSTEKVNIEYLFGKYSIPIVSVDNETINNSGGYCPCKVYNLGNYCEKL